MPESLSNSVCETLRLDLSNSHVLSIQLYRPEVRNALNSTLLSELAETLNRAEQDPEIRCVVLSGNENAFAAGADVKEMADKTVTEILADSRIKHWSAIRNFSKPLIAAVNGYCLGGGNELAMLCDIIIAGEQAKFGQPEIKLGLIPGAGGTQRLTQAMGKSKAMQYLLTGDLLNANAALNAGLVSEVVPSAEVLPRALEIAEKISQQAPIAIKLIKESVSRASDTLLQSGLDYERKAFTILFATEDRQEGVSAFLEKRKPEFKGR